ncbi:Phage head-tail connector domain protein [Candidatus Hepatincolaceae symbiont of Richtersius coronifer]
MAPINNLNKNSELNIVNNTLLLYENLKQERYGLEKIWQQVAHYVRPQRKLFKEDLINNQDIYDSTAIVASEQLVSGLWSMVSSSASSWFYLRLKNMVSGQEEEIKSWLGQINHLMKENLSDASSGFYYKSYEFYADLVCFGTGIFYMTENLEDKKVIYTAINLSETFITKTYNQIDTVIRIINLTSKQAMELFGYANVSKAIKEDYYRANNSTGHTIFP